MVGPKLPYMAVVGDRKPLAWVLEQEKIAFPEQRYRHTFPHLKADDVVYLYATRGAFRNPSRDRGRVIARTVLTAELSRLENPVRFDRPMPYQAPIIVEALAPLGQGLDLSSVIDIMTTFPIPERWAVYLRRSVLPITDGDARLFDQALKPYEGKLHDHLGEYQRMARIGVVAADEASP